MVCARPISKGDEMREKRMTKFDFHSMMMTRRARRGCQVVVPGRRGEIYPLDVVGLAPLLECSLSTLRLLAVLCPSQVATRPRLALAAERGMQGGEARHDQMNGDFFTRSPLPDKTIDGGHSLSWRCCKGQMLDLPWPIAAPLSFPHRKVRVPDDDDDDGSTGAPSFDAQTDARVKTN